MKLCFDITMYFCMLNSAKKYISMTKNSPFICLNLSKLDVKNGNILEKLTKVFKLYIKSCLPKIKQNK